MTTSLETKVAVMQNQINNIEKKVDEGFEAVNQKLDNFIKAAEVRFAGKWVEKIMFLVAGAVIVAIIGLIFKK